MLHLTLWFTQPAPFSFRAHQLPNKLAFVPLSLLFGQLCQQTRRRYIQSYRQENVFSHGFLRE